MKQFSRLIRQIRTNAVVHCALLVSFVGFAILLESLPPTIVRVCLGVALVGLLYHTVLSISEQRDAGRPWPLSRFPGWGLFLLPVGALVGAYSLSNRMTLLRIVVFGALLVVFFYFWFILPAAWYHKLRADDRHGVPDPPESSLSVLVPAYNEESGLGRTIDSLVAARYPGDKEIIVVDDGSTDGTYETALAHATDAVTVVRKPNGGKHSALNYGLERATGDAVVTVDADSVVTEDALVRIVTDLEADPNVAAVGGTVKLLRTDSLVEKLQALEYAVGINTFRRAFAMLGSVNVVPGCLGCFRREALEAVDGYDGDTLTEDFDVTIKLLKAGWDVQASEAVSYTEPPGTWRDLYRQRVRWNRGNIETIRKHADVLRGGSWSNFAGIVFPYQAVSLVVLPLATAVILGTIGAEAVSGHVTYVVTILALFTLLQVLASLFALVLDENDLRLLAYAPIAVVWYKYYMSLIMIKSLLDEILRADRQWNRVSRRAVPTDAEASDEGTAHRLMGTEGGPNDD